MFFSNSYLGFDHSATLFHIRDTPADPVERPVYLTNTFSFAILIHDVLLPEEAKTMFKVCLGTLILLILLICQANDADTLFFLSRHFLGSQLQQTSLNSSKWIRIHLYSVFYAIHIIHAHR